MSLIRSFAEDRSGATAMLFGLCLIPVVASVGAALDFARAANVRTGLQMAVDATALAMARDLGSDFSSYGDKRLAEYAQKMFPANFQRTDGTLGSVGARNDGGTIKVSADATVKTSIMGLFHIDTIKVAATGSVGWSPTKIDLALVLDNTLSMASSGKMTELKKAINDLLKDMEPYKESIRISIIPFDTQVNVGTSFRGASWLTYTADLPFEMRVARADWQGCIADRNMPFDASANSAVGTQSLYPAARCATGSLAEIQPLTSNYNALRDTVRSMTPSGYTNLTIGVAWGMSALTGGSSFESTVPVDPKKVQKIMVVLTDGDNTLNRYTSLRQHIDVREREIDARARLACGEARTKGIQVFTVRVIEGNANLLRDCATTPDMYKEVTNASQLSAVFRDLAKKIAGIRLTS
jgi:Flp pilus assembly protein TadG